MLEFHSMSSESHKANFQTVVKWHEGFAAFLTMVIYRTDRVAGEQIISVVSLEIANKNLFSGSVKAKDKDLFVLALTTPEAHAAYQVFLNGNPGDLETFLTSKIKEHLLEGTNECSSQDQSLSSEKSNQAKLKSSVEKQEKPE